MGSLKATDYKRPPQILNFVGAVCSEKRWLNDGKENSRNFPQGNRVYGTDGLSSTISAQGGGQGAKTGLYAVLTPDRVNKRQNGRRMKTDGEPSFTLNTQDRQGIYDGVSVRRLMPIECERLMGLKNDWTQKGIGEKGEYELSDSARYRLCGNGVVVPVVKEIIKRLLTNSQKGV
jgi:DNA (cytosine-5)-methyltransferase 1